MSWWPWVRAAEYQHAMDEIHRLEVNVALAREAMSAFRQLAIDRGVDYAGLLEKYHALRLQGAAPPMVVQPLPRAERDEVYDAIELQAGGDPTLKRHLLRYAKEQQLHRVDPTDIINTILHWQSDDDEDTPPLAH